MLILLDAPSLKMAADFLTGQQASSRSRNVLASTSVPFQGRNPANDYVSGACSALLQDLVEAVSAASSSPMNIKLGSKVLCKAANHTPRGPKAALVNSATPPMATQELSMVFHAP
jgi:hypothetical protein